jgi:hypothetical protein
VFSIAWHFTARLLTSPEISQNVEESFTFQKIYGLEKVKLKIK